MFKKIFLMAAIASLPFVASAQSSPYMGVRLSFDVTHPAGSNDGINNGSGFSLIGIYNMPISRNAYIEPGVGIFYNTMGIAPIETDNALWDGSVRNFGLRVPVNIGYRCEIFNDFELAAFSGPWFNVNLSTQAHLQPNLELPITITSPSMFDYGWHHFDAQWGFGISATYAHKYYISVSGGIGMTPMATFKTPDSKNRLRRNTISITVGYNF